MHRFDIRDLTRDYAELVAAVSKGDRVAPRGRETLELRNAVLVFSDAHDATFPVGIGRGANKNILAAELCQWAGGFSDLRQLNDVSSGRFINFSDDGIRLQGAYGPRSYAGLRRSVEVLMADPMSRQAVVPLWKSDEPLVTKDLPCTATWSFLVRDGRLHMTTFMRSNDVWTGVVYDVPAMARIQSALAWALGLETGEYVHHAQSLHIYEDDLEAALHLATSRKAEDDAPFFDHLSVTDVAWDPQEKWEWLVRQFMAVTRGEYSGPKELEWYADRLADTDRYDHFCVKCRYFLPQAELICP